MTSTEPGRNQDCGVYVTVAVPLGVRKTFAYTVPPAMRSHLKIGARLLVPFGRRLITGFAVGLTEVPPAGGFRLRPVRALIDRHPLVSEELIRIALWVADYYFTPPGPVINALFPLGAQVSGTDRVRISARGEQLTRAGELPPSLEPETRAILEILAREGELSLDALERHCGLKDCSRWLESAAIDGWVELEGLLEKPRVRAKSQLGICVTPDASSDSLRLPESQRRLLDALRDMNELRLLQPILRLAGCTVGAARSLEKKGLVKIESMEVDRLPIELADVPPEEQLVLTGSQSTVLEGLRALLAAGRPQRCLLHGVTGSGKTEIYLRLIGEVLARGDTAMLLVPEIGLTPLLSRIVASRFPDRVAVLHSGMGAGERLDQWHRIRSGRAAVVLGTRSAVFAPMEGLRLVIIDEEQDASYKQDESPCYHAREIAWQRIRHSCGLLLMGSATPSIETHHAAVEAGETAYLALPERIFARPLPEVRIIDMGMEFQRHGRNTVISEALREELAKRVGGGEQSIVLLNRRGFSRALICRSCGHSFTCPECSVTLTYHQEQGRLVCHYCGNERALPETCSQCGGPFIYFVGVGTEQLEQMLRTLLPRARIARVDRDTTRRRGALRRILFDFQQGALDIMVGTQMLAKGHDFPNLTLVGVVGADVGLAFPDFRSGERTFQLLTQVAGRAGRGSRPGQVIIQSFYPDHYALAFARAQDYAGFYSREIEFRRLMVYPPFNRLIQIIVSDRDARRGARTADKVARAVRQSSATPELGRGTHILGPAPAPLEKLRGLHRFQVLIKCPEGFPSSAILGEAFGRLAASRVPLKNVHVDVDPLSLM